MSLRRAIALEDLWDGEMQPCEVAARRLVLVRLGDVVRAYEDRCMHLGVALSEGELRDGVLTCRAHHWQYDARTGKGINPANVCLRNLPVLIEDGAVFVDVEAPP